MEQQFLFCIVHFYPFSSERSKRNRHQQQEQLEDQRSGGGGVKRMGEE